MTAFRSTYFGLANQMGDLQCNLERVSSYSRMDDGCPLRDFVGADDVYGAQQNEPDRCERFVRALNLGLKDQ